MEPVGYMLMQHAERLGQPTKAYGRWQARIPGVYHESVLGQTQPADLSADRDPMLILRIKNYRSLMPMAMDARKPMFLLKPADGAIGAHQTNVWQCYDDFRRAACEIGRRTGFDPPFTLPASPL